MKNLLSRLNLKSFTLIEFVLLLLLVVILPWSWQYAIWVVGLLVVNTVAKCIAERRVGNTELTRLGRIGLWLVVALVGWYGISLLWSADKELGGEMMMTKLSMGVLALVFLCSDMSYGDRRHLRIVMYAFVVSLSALFLYRLGATIYTVVTEDKTFSSQLCFHFDLVRHHAYIALYGMVALWWLYREMMEEWKEMPKWLKVMAVVCSLCIVADVLFVNSRAGILVLWASAVLIPMHMFFVRKRRALGVIWLVIFVGGLSGVFAIMPEDYNRVADTMKEVAEGDIVVENLNPDEDDDEAVGEDSTAVAIDSTIVAMDSTAVVEDSTVVKAEAVKVVDTAVAVTDSMAVTEDSTAVADSTAVEKEDEEEVKQSDARFTIWKVALNVAKEDWLIGTGVGDRADRMEEEYKELGWDERRQNAHNQYLDTLVSTGVLGLILLLVMFAVAFVDAIKQKSLILGALVAIMAFNMLFETMFDRQMGLLFWGLMLGLLSLEAAKNYVPEEPKKDQEEIGGK